MALPAASYPPPPLANPIAVVGSQFLAPYPVDLIMVKKLMTLEEGTFTVTDINGNIMLKMKGSIFSIHDRRTLLDASDNPIISLQQKMHKQHNVHSVLLGKDTFAVTVYPNVDYAFIVGLVVILYEINDDRKDDD